MNHGFESLRLSVALAHMAPGASVRVVHRDGTELVASACPAADVNICELRMMVAAGRGSSWSDLESWMESTGISGISAVGGSVQDCGNGLYRFRAGDREQRWFATTLSPAEIVEVLERIEADDSVNDVLDVTLKPDFALHVTMVCIQAADRALDNRLTDPAMSVYGACLAEELTKSTLNDQHDSKESN